ncbi:hypothetical protein J4434_02410 [Candidatus Woesearchaeota archaeon]|nr:hypothetical protein [Candidatus Woesearchaeota archaeon]
MAKTIEQITEEIINKRPTLLVRILKTPITYLTASLLSLLSCEANHGTQVLPSNSGQECLGQNCYGTNGITNTKPSNKVMDQSTAYYLDSISADKSTLIFNAQSTYAQNLIQGDLIIAGITDKTQEGLLRKVTSVTKNSSQIVAYTVLATLEDAVPEGTVQLFFSLSTGNAKADSAIDNFDDAQFDSTQLPLSFSGGQMYEFDHKELFSGIYLDGSMHIAVNADFQFTNSTLYGTKEVRFVTKGLEELELIVSGEFHAGINKELPPVELVKFPPVVIIPPGFVFPVVITPHLTLNFGVSANGNISAQTSITQSLVVDAGLEYKNNTWSKIQNIQPEFSSTIPEFTGVSGDFTVYVKPQLLLDFYGLDGPYIALKGYLLALAEVTPSDNVSCSIVAGIDALVGVHIEIISKTLFDYEASVYKYEKEIFNCSNTSPDCTSHNSFICGAEEKKVYWLDSCGNIEEAAIVCEGDSYCFNGECVISQQTCEDECDIFNEKSCSGKNVMTCNYNNSTGCLELIVQESCEGNEKCEGGECVPESTICVDECNNFGEKKCFNNGWKECGFYDSDNCLDWSVLNNCEKCIATDDMNELICVVDSFSTPGNASWGLTWDGEYLLNVDAGNNTVYKITTDGQIIASFSIIPEPRGIAFNEQQLWISSSKVDDGDEGLDTIIYQTTLNGEVLNKFNSGVYALEGIAFDGETLWLASYWDNTFYKMNLQGEIKSQVTTQIEEPYGLEDLSFHEGFIWCSVVYLGNKIYKLNNNGQVINSFEAPGGKYGNNAGLTWGGEYLWTSDSETDKIYKIKLIN